MLHARHDRAVDDGAVHAMDMLRDPDAAGADGLGRGDDRATLAQERSDLRHERTLLARAAPMTQRVAIAQRRAAFVGMRGGGI